MPFSDEILCPRDEQLAAYFLGTLPAIATLVVEAHLEICEDCREFVHALHYLRDDLMKRSA